MGVVSILAWNILHGGSSRRLPHIALLLVERGADLIVLSEYRHRLGGQLRGVLADHGWPHQLCSNPGDGVNGLLLASRFPLTAGPAAGGPRMIEAEIPAAGLSLVGVHVPCPGPETGRLHVWQRVIEAAARVASRKSVLIGDFNTGRHGADEAGATFRNVDRLGVLASLGYRDAWRDLHPTGRDPTFVSRGGFDAGKGFRIDHAFVSASASGLVRSAEYSHAERAAGLSDHSSLLVSLDAPRPGAETPESPRISAGPA